MQYFSAEYFEELARRLNTDAEWKTKAATLSTKITLTATDRGESYMIEVTRGTVIAKSVRPEDPADFKFEGPYDLWSKVATGQTDFNTAVITGKMKFRGSLGKILGLQTQMNRLTAIARGISSEV